MNRLFIFTIFCSMVLGASAQYNMDNLKLEASEATEDFTYGKLRLYPITANRVFLESHKALGNYIDLKEGLEKKTVRIVERGTVASNDNAENPTRGNENPQINRRVEIEVPVLEEPEEASNDAHVEQHLELTNQDNRQPALYNDIEQVQVQQLNIDGGGSDQVNKLYLENTGKDTLFIMAGEVIKGGKQDRVIAQDMIVPPNSGLVDLSVFCVERGRWHYGTTEASAFDGYANVSSMNVRKAAVTVKEQGAVWDSVKVVTSTNNASSETHTYNAIEKSEEFQKELKYYIDRFQALPENGPSVVGVVVTTGDRVIGCDMFATPALFKKAYPNLLHSYATEAITRGSEVTIKDKVVQKYIEQFLANEARQEKAVEGNGTILKNGTKKIHFSTF